MKNKIIFLLSIIFIFVIICFSFGEVVHDYMPNYIDYFKIEKYCPGDHEVCQSFQTEEDVKQYLKEKDPRKRLDVITLSDYVINTRPFAFLILLLPFIVIIHVISQAHDEVYSNYSKNKLKKMKLKDFMKQYILVAAKSALLVSLTYFFIFFISCVITGFHFEFKSFRFDYFFIDWFVLAFIQYLLYFGYSLIGILASFLHKNKIVCSVIGCLYLIVVFAIYTVFGAVVVRDALRISFGTDNYFDLLGNYWSFNHSMNIFWSFAVIISFILIISRLLCTNKSRTRKKKIERVLV